MLCLNYMYVGYSTVCLAIKHMLITTMNKTGAYFAMINSIGFNKMLDMCHSALFSLKLES